MAEGSEVDVTCSAFLWAILRHQQWDPELDDPSDVDLHEHIMAKAREVWPWLDEAADQYESGLPSNLGAETEG